MIIPTEILFSLFDVLVFDAFLGIFIDRRKVSTLYRCLFSLLLTICIFYFTYIDVVLYLSATLIIFSMGLFAKIVYKIKIIELVVISLFFHIGYMVITLLVTALATSFNSELLIEVYEYGSINRVVFIILLRVIMIILITTYSKKYRINLSVLSTNKDSMKISLYSLVVFISVIGLFIYEQRNVSLETYIFVFGAIIITINMFLSEKEANQQNQEVESLKLVTQAYQMHTDLLKKDLENVKELKRLKHDLNNKLLFIESLLREDNYVDAKRYINELTMSPVLSKRYNTGSVVIDALLNSYCQMYPEITFNVDIKSGEFQISDLSIATIFGNALTNAIEAVECTYNKSIDVYIDVSVQRIIFKISNEFLVKPVKKDNIIQTIKSDPLNHGIGLKSIKKEVSKYNGTVNVNVDHKNNIFTLIVLLMNNN